MRHLRHIRIMLNIQISASPFRSHEGEQNHISVHRSQKDADDLAIVVPLDCFALLDDRSEWVLFTNGRLNCRRSRTRKIAELVRCSDHEGSQAARGKLHQVDWDNAPGALNAELFEECCCDDSFAAGECVGVEQGSADDTDKNDAEAPAEDLAAVPDHGAAGHGAQVCDDLSDRDGVGGELELVC